MPLIGLLGPAGSGKSTVSNFLEENYGAKRYTLAAPLKEIVGRAFSLTDDQLYGPQSSKEAVDPRYNVSPRWLFQRIGTEGIRNVFGPNVWVNHLLDKWRDDMPPLAVVDDVRFVNEATVLQQAGAKIWRLENAAITTASSHPSETEWLNCPYDVNIIHDGKDLAKLHARIMWEMA